MRPGVHTNRRRACPMPGPARAGARRGGEWYRTDFTGRIRTGRDSTTAGAEVEHDHQGWHRPRRDRGSGARRRCPRVRRRPGGRDRCRHRGPRGCHRPRRHRLLGDPGLHRHPHPLRRRAGDGTRAVGVVAPRGDHGPDRVLRPVPGGGRSRGHGRHLLPGRGDPAGAGAPAARGGRGLEEPR